jgi:phenylalanyl-tRNA synthetase beta chain
MKFFVNWLGEFVDLPEDPEEIADLLTRAGVETKNIETRGAKIDNVIVSQITASSRHPNADRLTVCEVNDGSGTKRQIVCGATNYKVGDKVPLALPGAKLPNGTEIRKSKLRGVESEGMLCSAIELGLGQDASGLLILSPEAKIGGPIGDVFPSETILDVEITPNRGDLLSHFGLAREIAALTGNNVKSTPREAKIDIRKTGVTISATRECPFFSARKIDNVKVGPSPQWLRAKIESVGVRSINNIVDISNFVMLELGQPTHAFDADKLNGGINVRLARDGEKFLALDGKTYSLKPDNLVVADQERAVGIAGVMGGEETGVTESTKNILLESAYFLPASVRRTARNLSLPSDASYRFERGVDPGMVLRASLRATELIREITGGTPAKEIATAGKIPVNPSDVLLSYEKCDRVVGIAIKPRTVDEILTGFGLQKTSAAKMMKWKIPSHRQDLQRDVDLIEEVVRAFGVDKVPGTDRSRFTPSSAADRSHDFEEALRHRLTATGLTEVRTSKLISRRATESGESAIILKNPLTEEHVALRPSLIGGLVGVLETNIRSGNNSVAIFEIGRVFRPPDSKEERHLGILLWGQTFDSKPWQRRQPRTFEFYDLKDAIASALGNADGRQRTTETKKLSFRQSGHSDLAIATAAFWGDSEIGFAGQLRAQRAAEIDAYGPVCIADIRIEPESGTPPVDSARDGIVHVEGVSAAGLLGTVSFKEIPKFPPVVRDIAMVAPNDLSHDRVMDVIWESAPDWLQRIGFFDAVVGKKADELFGAGNKSVAYRLTYRDRSRTLTSEEVDAAHAKIRAALRQIPGAQLRE